MSRKLVLVLVLVSFPATMVFAQDIIYFDAKDEFELFNREHGKVQKGVLEDFENNNVGDNEVVTIIGRLEGGVPNGPFPEGLRNLNLSITAKAGDLVLLTRGFFDVNSDKIGANTFTDSTQLHFASDDKTGVGFMLADPINGGLADIEIYDTNDILIDTIQWPAPIEPNKSFFGVWSAVPIGRIWIAAQNDGGELIDNVQMWVPEPACLSLLLLGGLAVIRRR